jgi:vacuolar-type H+-ATPase subunit I/STV1
MKKVLIGAMVVVVGLAAVVWAAEEGKAKEAKAAKEARPARPTMPMSDQMRGAGPNMRGSAGMQSFEVMLKQRKDEHAKAVGELEEIKKIAESENATKTVEALQKMIDKKNEAFNKNMAEIEKRQKDRMEMIQKRQQEIEARKAAAPPTNEDKKAITEEK